jgi:hypothetical protein
MSKLKHLLHGNLQRTDIAVRGNILYDTKTKEPFQNGTCLNIKGKYAYVFLQQW